MNEDIKAKLEHKKCTECTRMYTNFKDVHGNRVCIDCQCKKLRSGATKEENK